jgi:hypothetical protein
VAMAAAKQASATKQAKEVKESKGNDEEARPEVYNSVRNLLHSLVCSIVSIHLAVKATICQTSP